MKQFVLEILTLHVNNSNLNKSYRKECKPIEKLELYFNKVGRNDNHYQQFLVMYRLMMTHVLVFSKYLLYMKFCR
jgi:hypothetical protein